MTTVRIDGTRIGQTAAQYIDHAGSRGITQPVVDIGFSIVERATA